MSWTHEHRPLAPLWLALLSLTLCQPVAGESGPRSTQLPPFLPAYFSPSLMTGGEPLQLAGQSSKDGLEEYRYSNAGRTVEVVVSQLTCATEVCLKAMSVALQAANSEITKASGRFDQLATTEFTGSWEGITGRTTVSVFQLPRSVLFWTSIANNATDVASFPSVLSLVNRQRYEVASTLDNVEFGRWGAQVNEYARQLLATGQKAEALAILKKSLVTFPNDLPAQMDFAENTDDKSAARASARMVFDNAETPAVAARAARFLGESEPSLAQVPLLEKGEKGLQVILIPLEPCDLRLLKQAAELYESAFQIPVKIRRLETDWRFGPPDRIAGQRQAEQAILELRGTVVDFSGWSKDRYTEGLQAATGSKDALTRYSVDVFVDQIKTLPGQYEVNPYLAQFIAEVAPYRSPDNRTMYVGVTGASIYSGDLNFLFNLFGRMEDGSSASVLSYAMMLRSSVGGEYESRALVTERLVKEMVPASLQGLGIPRAVDPTDPYSYSGGTDRLAQKTLKLSPTTKAALDEFRK